MGKSEAEMRTIQLGLILVLMMISASAAMAQFEGAQIREREIHRAYQSLLNANIFNLGGVGFGMEITAEEKAFRTLINAENSVELFKRLLSEANPEGQIYALYALYLKEPAFFKHEAERLVRENGPAERREGLRFIEAGMIRTASGCILFRQDRKTIIDRMANGDFDRAFHAGNRRIEQD